MCTKGVVTGMFLSKEALYITHTHTQTHIVHVHLMHEEATPLYIYMYMNFVTKGMNYFMYIGHRGLIHKMKYYTIPRKYQVISDILCELLNIVTYN